MKYIAFLRGINVGGNNKISMAELKNAFQNHGFSDVQTYINSGNLIFSALPDKEDELKKKCESVLTDEFNVSVPVAVLSADDLTESLDNAPSWWNADSESKHNAIVVISPAQPSEITDAVGGIKPEYENVECFGKIIFWSAPLKTFSRTKWSKIVGTPAYEKVTIRNANTMLKLAKMVRQD
ncbi:hypothetical protein MmiAt1_15850 [Methanimicrococcus sp. At1]|uniref:DUF1697 domain-containing protein n=1 Tax=Methanimicrococcus hacksteinii TaxID=3028293 RepID=A0ABU3VRF5_9EURY|nr:DUF1697 domain-containing protein [Methanimicrococcus sp. At1]MDV0445980.1 hypothetical protein [Methanimicrococcus sp. At1]